MKKFFPFLLFFFLFAIILSNKQKQKLNENETEIADTDSDIIDLTDIEDTDFENITSLPVEEYVDYSPLDEPESANSFAENAPISAEKPVAVTPKIKDMKNAHIHLMKIYNFYFPTSETMAFKALFYFFGKPIVKYIILRTRVNFHQEDMVYSSYSARTDCSMINHYKNRYENELNGIKGEYANYNCEILRMYGSTNPEVILNTDVPMTVVGFDNRIEAFDFTEINFNGNASDESSFIQENTINMEKFGILENTEVFVDNNNTLVFRGDLNPPKAFEKVKKIKMLLMNKENGEIITKNYSCDLIIISKSIYDINCNISESYIITTVNNLQLSTGISEKGEGTEEGVFLTIDLKYGLGNETEIIINPVQAQVNQIIYRKSSDGLSGGAIAGIVIAGVAVIATISIITIILIKRKTKPPVDNTTIVDMNPDQNKIDTNKIDPNKTEPNKNEPNKTVPNKTEPGNNKIEKIDQKIDYGSKK